MCAYVYMCIYVYLCMYVHMPMGMTQAATRCIFSPESVVLSSSMHPLM